MTLPRVLLVDDVDELRVLVRTVLRRSGQFEVVAEGANGREGVELAARHQPDLVLLDLSMPEMDGLEAIPLIHQVAPATEIVVFSGFEEGRVAEVALQLKASRYVRKGASLEELRDAVRDLAERVA